MNVRKYVRPVGWEWLGECCDRCLRMADVSRVRSCAEAERLSVKQSTLFGAPAGGWGNCVDCRDQRVARIQDMEQMCFQSSTDLLAVSLSDTQPPFLRKYAVHILRARRGVGIG